MSMLRVGPTLANEPSFVEHTEPEKPKKTEMLADVTAAAIVAELRRRGWSVQKDDEGRTVLTEPLNTRRR